MIALDTNVLVHAHRRDSPWHGSAAREVKILAEGAVPWAIPWPCLCEFLSVVTHPRIFSPPSNLGQALAQVEAWFGSPSLTVLAEDLDHWPTLKEQLVEGRVTGPRVHDARIAAICLMYGVEELWSVDRDFGRFPTLKVRNPLVP